MSATITGLGSGFDIDGWVTSLVSAKKESTVTPLETKLTTLNNKSSAVSGLKSKCSTLLTALQTFTKTMYDSTSDMWANTSITSSDSAYATATSKGNVAAASVDLKIEQIATSTKATSNKSLGIVSSSDVKNTKFTSLANGQAKEGDFSMFVDGKEYKVTIDADDTVKDVMNKIYDATNGKVQASVNSNGYFSLETYKRSYGGWRVDESANLSLGTSADTSNFASALKMTDKVGTHGYKSAYAISTISTNASISSDESGLRGVKFYDENGQEASSGTITINGVDFNIDQNTSLNDLIAKINGNSDANVQASYDSLTNKLILTSSETGENNISLSETGTNLLNVLGLTEIKSNGDEVLASNSQELGKNAILYVNGNKVISTSNTITGESSGISNLSVTIKKPTSDYTSDSNDPTSVTLDIEPDYSAVETALNTFVTAYNDVISTIKTTTTSSGTIGSDSTLRNFASTLKSIVSGANENDGAYKILSQIGISTSTTDISNLSIDSTKLKEALKENTYSVKQLLSDGYTAQADTGIFDQMAEALNTILDSEKGYFSSFSDSIDTQISNLNSKIETANKRLTTYQTQIKNKFNKMDSTLASLSSQLSTFQSYFS